MGKLAVLTLQQLDLTGSLLICFKHPSVAVCRFPNTGDDWYVLVGVARDMILNPRSVGGGFIYTYRLNDEGEKLEFVHKVGLITGKMLSFHLGFFPLPVLTDPLEIGPFI